MEARLFDPANPPEWTTPEWYAGREAAPHLEQEGHRDRLLLAADMVQDAIDMCGLQPNIMDLGAGDGGLLSLVQESKPDVGILTGYDLQQSNVDAAAARGIELSVADVTGMKGNWWGDIVVVCEVLEHLVDPHALLRRLHADRWTDFLVASSPFMETPDAHYEYHTWCWDQAGYMEMLESCGWHVIRQELAWICQVVLCERKP